MSIQAVAWALEEEEIPARPKLVLVAIANHANHVDGYCWLKAETIAREAACTPRSVYRFIGGLVRNGYLRKAPRKGEDGKQRANDYWILFNRERKPWDWGASGEDGGAIEDGETESPEAQDVVEPTDTVSHGESTDPHDSGDSRQEPDMHAVSAGPDDGRVSRIESAEPSKIKPEKDAGARAFDPRVPRAYRPPPPQPMGALSEKAKDPVFVFEGSRAWEAWVAFKKRTTGHTWTLSRSTVIDGKHRTGWWFPTLFPPSDKAESNATGPPDQSAA